MPVSTFHRTQLNSIDVLPSPTGSAVPNIFNLGLQYLGGSKSMQRRPLLDFNLYGTAAEGRPLNAADIIQAADLILYPDSIVGGSGFDCTIERITQPAWVQAEARWDRYSVGNNWIAAGGDVDTVTPTPVTFTSPIVILADLTVAGLLAFVTDAIASRAGVVRMRLRKTDEAVATSHFFSAIAGTASPLQPRLRVTYATAEPRPMLMPDRNAQGEGSAQPARHARPAPSSRPARPATV